MSSRNPLTPGDGPVGARTEADPRAGDPAGDDALAGVEFAVGGAGDPCWGVCAFVVALAVLTREGEGLAGAGEPAGVAP
jgi:hypothetical protein